MTRNPRSEIDVKHITTARKLLDAGHGNRDPETARQLSAMLGLATFSLLRVGEMCALKARDLDLHAGRVEVASSVDHHGRPSAPKRGPRIVALTPPIQELARELILGKEDSDYVFMTKREKPCSPETVRRQVSRAERALNVRVSLISARSAGIREFARKGISPVDTRFQIGENLDYDDKEVEDAIARINGAWA